MGEAKSGKVRFMMRDEITTTVVDDLAADSTPFCVLQLYGGRVNGWMWLAFDRSQAEPKVGGARA